ncbi:MAG: sulfurtransferase [Planctomycetota bacterium]
MSATFQTIVTAQQLKDLLGDPNLVVVDCRFSLADVTSGRAAYDASRIPGAVYAHLDDDLSGPPHTDHGRHPLPSPERMAATFSRLGIDDTKQVIAYDDRNNMMASRLWWMLKYMGHRNIAVLDGGWTAWQSSGGEIETSSPQVPTVVEFSGQPNPNWLVMLDQVDAQQKLVDSRASERFRGDVEPLDPAAGHIPGAVNFHYARVLNDDATFQDPDSIRQHMSELFGDSNPKDVTFYCGSGVSACVNLIAASHAGFPMSKLYVGSWSEWSRKKAKPEA